MFRGSETAKHCRVWYRSGPWWWEGDGAANAHTGLTCMRQVKVWLLLLAASDPRPFTGERERALVNYC